MASFYCAMLAYSEFYGEWNDYRQSWKWHKLTNAMYQQRLPVKDAHGALGDCRMTLALLNKMYETK
jgi:DNA polymerase-3 subunit epsilon